MSDAVVKLKCFTCGVAFIKKKAEVTHRNKLWVAQGKKLPKPYFCCREHGQTYSGVTYNACRELKAVAATLRKREAPKYAKLRAWLKKNGVKHRFEHPVGIGVFDLALKLDDRKILVEFDGDYHAEHRIRKADARKEAAAKAKGWEVHRVHQPTAHVIPTAYVKALVRL